MRDKLLYIRSWLNYSFYILRRKISRGKYIKKKIIKKKILNKEETEQFYAELFLSGKPFMVGRIGTSESQALDHQIRVDLGFEKSVPEKTIRLLCNNAGFFPEDREKIPHYRDEYIKALKNCDLIASWSNNEYYLFKKYCKEARFCHLRNIEPEMGNPNSWIKYLQGKKVLVVHPFAQSIKKQYERKNKVFPNGFLPDFKLITLKAVQTIAGEKDKRFEDWFQALDYMKKQIYNIDFDIALIGCGAYGFPLAAYVKEIGKSAIHTAGSTQIIFGILGKRWENKEYLTHFINDYWIRPSEDEIVKGNNMVEGGCYW